MKTKKLSPWADAKAILKGEYGKKKTAKSKTK